MLADMDEAGLGETQALVAAAGGTASVHRVNVAHRTEVEALADLVAEQGRSAPGSMRRASFPCPARLTSLVKCRNAH